MVNILEPADFLNLQAPLIDVRSPIEYGHAHIPQAESLPLFSDEERSAVGTCYKQSGAKPALLLGLSFAGPKLSSFAEAAMKLGPKVRLYCFRGGMRSSSMAWLFEQAGVEATTLKGGYKAFRGFALNSFKKPFRFQLLGGLTGSGKTALLKNLKIQGEQILDLEELAGHRGSAFGLLGYPPQCSTEQFENRIALALHEMDVARTIWVEDESRKIGICKIPDYLYEQMKMAPLYVMEVPFEERIERLIEYYGKYSTEDLTTSVLKLSKRLGGVRTKEVLHAIQQGSLATACALLLEYYDATYRFSLKDRKFLTWNTQ